METILKERENREANIEAHVPVTPANLTGDISNDRSPAVVSSANDPAPISDNSTVVDPSAEPPHTTMYVLRRPSEVSSTQDRTGIAAPRNSTSPSRNVRVQGSTEVAEPSNGAPSTRPPLTNQRAATPVAPPWEEFCRITPRPGTGTGTGSLEALRVRRGSDAPVEPLRGLLDWTTAVSVES
jgi:hypothetical protein